MVAPPRNPKYAPGSGTRPSLTEPEARPTAQGVAGGPDDGEGARLGRERLDEPTRPKQRLGSAEDARQHPNVRKSLAQVVPPAQRLAVRSLHTNEAPPEPTFLAGIQ